MWSNGVQHAGKAKVGVDDLRGRHRRRFLFRRQPLSVFGLDDLHAGSLTRLGQYATQVAGDRYDSQAADAALKGRFGDGIIGAGWGTP